MISVPPEKQQVVKRERIKKMLDLGVMIGEEGNPIHSRLGCKYLVKASTLRR